MNQVAEEERVENIDIEEIKKILPHRYPFLLVDRILECEGRQRIVGLKNVTINEQFFQGHFPSRHVMPGVLMVEALAQVGGVLMLRVPENRNKLAFFMGIDGAKFRKPVVPGDQLRLEVEVLRWKKRTGKVQGIASVDGQVVCEAELTFYLVDEE
ncbi:MAG: 3-hydroxyacyl-ACP dehydratase FabZ [bacterium]|nr:3-hydroxyacyl-ACP dehydratase FabZ [bacterium]